MVSKTVVIIVALVVIVAGIGAAILYLAPDDWGQKENKTEIVVTDNEGREVSIEQPVERVIISMADMLNPFVGVVGEDFADYIVGGLDDFDMESSFRDIYYQQYPQLRDVPETGSLFNFSFNVEKVISLEPDVVFLPSYGLEFGFLSEQMLNQMDGIVTYVFIDFLSDPFKAGEYEKNVEIIGKVMGKEERAQDIIDTFMTEVNKVYDILPDVADPEKIRVFFETMMGPEKAEYKTSKIGYPEIDYVNGYNLANDLLGSSDVDGYIGKEAFLNANPDVICFAASEYFGDIGGTYFGYGKTTSQEQLQQLAEEYVSRTGWNTTNAVKEGQVFFTYGLLRAHLECFLTLQYMAKWLYPDVYSDLDPEANGKAFYDQFMPFEWKGVWVYQYQI